MFNKGVLFFIHQLTFIPKAIPLQRIGKPEKYPGVIVCQVSRENIKAYHFPFLIYHYMIFQVIEPANRGFVPAGPASEYIMLVCSFSMTDPKRNTINKVDACSGSKRCSME